MKAHIHDSHPLTGTGDVNQCKSRIALNDGELQLAAANHHHLAIP
jgi:hypothetical protein